VRILFQASVYPLIVGGSLAAGLFGIGRGVDPGVVLAVVTVAAALVVALVEVVLPYRRAWSRSKGDLLVDMLHAGSSNLAYQVGAVAVAAAGSAGAWPTRWPLAVQIPLALVVAELGFYALHRAEHRGGFLWRLHAVHHSAPRLYWLNANRNHPIDAFLIAVVYVGPLFLLGAGADLIALVTCISGAHGAVQHSNVDVRLGPLNEVVSGAEVHRWHHSRRLAEANGNYGTTLLVWDHVFRTRVAPEGRPPIDPGLGDLPWFPEGWVGQLAAPFSKRWRAARDGEDAGPDRGSV
jgi:sterol desaturase/sphingolipid hydroxylase (fatty acid hydroxylase superfamily)